VATGGGSSNPAFQRGNAQVSPRSIPRRYACSLLFAKAAGWREQPSAVAMIVRQPAIIARPPVDSVPQPV